MAEPMTDADVDFILERFDQTEPALQRRIVAGMMAELADTQDERDRLRAALRSLLDACRAGAPSDHARNAAALALAMGALGEEGGGL